MRRYPGVGVRYHELGVNCRAVIGGSFLESVLASLVIILSAFTACSRSDPPELWIWQFVEIPSEDGEWFEELSSVLSLLDAEGTVPPSIHREFCEALARLGNTSSNSAQLKHFRILGDKFFDRYEYHGREIKTSSLVTLVKAANSLSHQFIETGDLESADSLANSLLLLGYQMCRNGENIVVANLRLTVWRWGLDCVLATQRGHDPNTRTQVENAKERIRVEFAQIRERDSGRLYYPFR